MISKMSVVCCGLSILLFRFCYVLSVVSFRFKPAQTRAMSSTAVLCSWHDQPCPATLQGSQRQFGHWHLRTGQGGMWRFHIDKARPLLGGHMYSRVIVVAGSNQFFITDSIESMVRNPEDDNGLQVVWIRLNEVCWFRPGSVLVQVWFRSGSGQACSCRLQ